MECDSREKKPQLSNTPMENVLSGAAPEDSNSMSFFLDSAITKKTQSGLKCLPTTEQDVLKPQK